MIGMYFNTKLGDKDMNLNDILNDDEFGLLEPPKKQKTEAEKQAERVIDKFKDVNRFVDNHGREPQGATNSVTEFQCHAILKYIRLNDLHKTICKPYDKHNLL